MMGENLISLEGDNYYSETKLTYALSNNDNINFVSNPGTVAAENRLANSSNNASNSLSNTFNVELENANDLCSLSDLAGREVLQGIKDRSEDKISVNSDSNSQVLFSCQNNIEKCSKIEFPLTDSINLNFDSSVSNDVCMFPENMNLNTDNEVALTLASLSSYKSAFDMNCFSENALNQEISVNEQNPDTTHSAIYKHDIENLIPVRITSSTGAITKKRHMEAAVLEKASNALSKSLANENKIRNSSKLSVIKICSSSNDCKLRKISLADKNRTDHCDLVGINNEQENWNTASKMEIILADIDDPENSNEYLCSNSEGDLKTKEKGNFLKKSKKDDLKSAQKPKEIINNSTHKENLLGKLLEASQHCEPASLVPENGVSDLIPAVGYRIIDVSNLSDMIQSMHICCHSDLSNWVNDSIIIQEKVSLRTGAASQLSVMCTKCKKGSISSTSSKQNELFDINSRVELLKKEFGIEESKLQKMLEILGIFYRPTKNVSSSQTSQVHSQPIFIEYETVANQKTAFKDSVKVQKTESIKARPFQCKECSATFSHINYLNKHIKSHDIDTHICPYCQSYFKKVFNLQQHIKKHKNIKFACERCDKTYTDKSTLNAHIKKVHMKIFRLQCRVCLKKFYHTAHYEEHVRMHTGEKPFSCNLCDKKFAQVVTMKRHVLSHQNVKYSCRLCGKQFRLLQSIRQHLVQQHKLKKSDIQAQVQDVAS